MEKMKPERTERNIDSVERESVTILERTATECGDLVRSLRSQAMEANDKDEQLGAHFSTRADHQSQEHGLRILQEAFPNEIIVAEESEHGTDVPPDCIVFDPLDGTTNFFNGLDDYGVTLCMFRGGGPVSSATYFPQRQMLISAVRGEGCYVGGFNWGNRLASIPWHGMLDKAQIGTDIGSWTSRSDTFQSIHHFKCDVGSGR